MSVITESLLYRYDRGECSPSEERRVQEWIKADSNHKKKFKELQEIWTVEPSKAPDNDYDTARAWKRFKNSSSYSGSEPEASVGSAVRNLRWRYYAAAAVVLIAVGIYSFQNYYKSTQPYNGKAQKIITQKGERTDITLRDSTKITLNAASTLTIAEDYMEENRTVYLEGEAFFEVEHSQELPFIVVSGSNYARDMGTKFNVNTYESGILKVAVQEGAVSVGNMDEENPKESKADLRAHQAATLSESGRVNVKQINDIDLFSGWTKGKLVFDNATFAEVCKRLERHFDADCVIDDQSLRQRTLTASYDDIPLDEMLNVLSLTLNVSYEKDNGSIIFTTNSH